MATPLPGSFPTTSAYPGPYGYTGNLPLGTWNMMANGRVYQLELNAINGSRVDATLSSGDVVDAEWTGFANASTLAELSFTRVLESHGLKQRFTGYLLHFSKSDPLWRIVGTFRDATLDEEQAGWYATRPRS